MKKRGERMDILFWLKTILVLIILCIIGIPWIFRYFQDVFIYKPPDRTLVKKQHDQLKTILENKEDVKLISFKTSDGTSLSGIIVYAHCSSEKKTIIIFSTNSSYVEEMTSLILTYKDNHYCNIVMFSYRNFGMSEGNIPNEDIIIQDAKEIYYYVCSMPRIDSKKMVIYGNSLGGAVAIALVYELYNHLYDPTVVEVAPPIGLIVENSFTSIPELAPFIVKTLPYKVYLFIHWIPFLYYFLFDQNIWDSQERITNISCPVLFLSGNNDSFVPPEMMISLYKTCLSKDKNFVNFTNQGHILDSNSKCYVDSINKFLFSLYFRVFFLI